MSLHKKFPILIVEDEEDTVLILRRAASKGFPESDWVHVSSFKEAIDVIEQKGTGYFKLVFLDNNLNQDINGIEAVDLLKKWLLNVPIPVILISASIRPDDIKKAYGIGITSFIGKPAGYLEWIHYLSVIREYWYNIVKLQE